MGRLRKTQPMQHYRAKTRTPDKINPAPRINFILIGSPKTTTPRIIAITTLSLSIGATQEAGANCKAR